LTLGGNPLTIPGNGQTCASATDCSPQDYVTNPNWFQNQPYWNDTFELLAHPQFVAFVLGSGEDRYVYWAADAALVSVQVWQLSACSNNQMLAGTVPCQIPYSYSWENSSQQYVPAYPPPVLTLTAQEASNLLQLDPFYVAGTQAAPLANERVVPFPGPQIPYGTKFTPCPAGQPNCAPQTPQTYTASLTNTQANGSGTNGQKTYISTVTNVVGNSDTLGQTLNMVTPYISTVFSI